MKLIELTSERIKMFEQKLNTDEEMRRYDNEDELNCFRDGIQFSLAVLGYEYKNERIVKSSKTPEMIIRTLEGSDLAERSKYAN